jgi:hypothetical protein
MSVRVYVGLLCLTAFGCYAQSDRGTLTGVVADPSGAVIAAARVEITNTGTQAKYQTGTNGTGQYHMPNLPPGKYSVSFEATGFKKLVRSGFGLEATQVLRVDAVLEIGATAETVMVSGEVARIQTDTPEAATTMSGENMLALPFSFDGARVADNLVPKIAPGVTGTGYRTVINGTGQFSKETLLDGATVTTYLSGAFTETAVSMEAVGEFKSQTSGVSAEFGRTQGGIFNYVMKSGTNQIHGSAYGAIINEGLNANGFANNYRGLKRTRLRENDYAASFGGPVLLPKIYNGRNKTFFYFAWEHFKEIDNRPDSANSTYPLPEFYQGNFSRLLGASVGTDALGNSVAKGAIYDPNSLYQLANGRWVGQMFPNNTIPTSRFSSVAQKLNAIAQKYYTPTIKDSTGQVALQNNAYGYANSTPSVEQNNESIKVDHDISPRNKLSAMYSLNRRPRELIVKGGMWSFDEPDGGVLSRSRWQHVRSQLARVSYDAIITPSTLNHLNVSFNRMANPLNSNWSQTDGAAELGIAGLHTDGYPAVDWGSGPYYGLSNVGYSEKMFEVYFGYGLTDTISFSKGRHFMKAGIDLRRNGESTRPASYPSFTFSAAATSIPNETFSTSKTGYAFASYLLGAVSTYTLTDPIGMGERRHYYAAFFQDDFKVSNRLTLQLGLRWEYQPPFTEAANRIASWDPAVKDPKSGFAGAYTFAGKCSSCTGQNYFGVKDHKDFSPRIGFAYRVAKNWSVRGAYAIMYDGDSANHFNSTPLGNASSFAWRGTYTYTPSSATSWVPVFNWDNGIPSGHFTNASYDQSWANANSAGMIDKRYGLSPYVQDWNFNVQRQLPGKVTIDAGYFGNKATRLRNGEMVRLNQLDPAMLAKYGRGLTNSVTTPAEAAANGVAYPYAGFSGTVASALRQFPQLYGNSTVSAYGTPLGFSNHHSLQVAVNRQFTEGLTVYANYTYARTMSNTNSNLVGDNSGALDYYNLKNEKAVSSLDVPHAFKVYYSYELPFGRGKGLFSSAPRAVKALVSGWSTSGILNYFSGQPLGFSATTPLSGGWNGGSNRANIAAGSMKNPDFDKSKFNYANTASSTNTYLNKSLFSDAPSLTLGSSAPRYSQIRKFGTINEDLVLAKNMRIKERVRWQLRAEALNAFNRSTLGSPNTSITNSLFGQITSISGNRTVQLVTRFDF